MGVWEAITQWLAIGYLTKRFSESELIYLGNLISSLSFIGISFAHKLEIFLLLMIPYSISTSTTRTCLTSALSKQVREDNRGITLGVRDSLESIGKTASPTVSGLLIDTFGIIACPLSSAIVTGSLGIYLMITQNVVSSTIFPRKSNGEKILNGLQENVLSDN